MAMKYPIGSANLQNTLISVNGPTHAQGGVNVNPEVEIQNGEAVFDGFVFSNLIFGADGINFAKKAEAIEKRYKNRTGQIDASSKRTELERLAQEQEQIKLAQAHKLAQQSQDSTKTAPQMPNLAPDSVGIAPDTTLFDPSMIDPSMVMPQDQMMYGGSMKKKMFLGGAIAAGAGSLINIGRGIFEKPRQYDKINLGRSSWENAEFENVDFDNVDYSEQRNLAARDAERFRVLGNANARRNAASAGQLLGVNMLTNARAFDTLNSVNRESLMTEENTNVMIDNQENQLNTQINNAQEQFNVAGRNRTNMYNTQIGNQEALQNFQIGMMNAQNRDAQRQMMWDGVSGLLGAAGSASNAMYQDSLNRGTLGALGMSPDGINAALGKRGFGSMLGFGGGGFNIGGLFGSNNRQGSNAGSTNTQISDQQRMSLLRNAYSGSGLGSLLNGLPSWIDE